MSEKLLIEGIRRYWIPGPLTNYGTTSKGFAGEVLVVSAADYHELELALRDARLEVDRVHTEHAEMIDGYEAKLQEYERRIDELQDAAFTGAADQPTAVQDDARDAARYRWLRSRSYVWADGTPLYREEQEESIALWLKQSMSEKAMDNAIDAASAADNSNV